MSATRPRLVARSRWSLASKCSRAASYALLGIPPEEERLREDVRALMRLDIDGLRRRGKRLGQVRAEQYAERYGAANVLFEKEVTWPSGVAHADVFVRPEALTVEVKSVQPRSMESILDAAILQVAGLVHFDSEAERGLLEFVSPIDESVYEAVPVLLSDDLVERVEAAAHAVATAGITQGAELPERVCQRPSDAASRLCPFAAHCFDGWQEEHPPVEVGDPETITLVKTLYQLKTAYRNYQAEAEERKVGYTEVQARLVELGFEPGVDYLVDGIKVRRVVTAASESFSLAKARKSGNWTALEDERFSFALSQRSGSERWSVDLVSGEPPRPDFGDEAPWTEADL